MANVYNILTRKCEGKKSLWRPRPRWKIIRGI